MADTLTLLQLRTRARERANMENSTFVTDSELTGYVNHSYRELYDLITKAVEDYNITESSFSIASGNTSALPSDFYKFRGLDDLTDTSRPRTVRKYNWNERNDYFGGRVTTIEERFSEVYYRIVGSNLVIMPPERAVRAYKLYYVPFPANLSADGDLATSINGWLEYVIVDAAIKCLIKEESDVRPLMATKKALIDRIEAMRAERDQAAPEKISRIRTRRRNSYFWDNSEEYTS